MSEEKKEQQIPGRPNPWAGRPVRVDDLGWDEVAQKKEKRSRTGTFHCWGFKRMRGDKQQDGLHTVGIVELEDGRITTKLPDFITFLDRTGNKHPNQPEPHV